MGEVVGAHAVRVLEVADHRLDGGPPFELALDLRRDAALLAGGVNLELVVGRGVVARRHRSRSRARLSSLASVGNITAFGCTVVSITTRARSDGFIASVRVATARLSCSNA